MTPIPKEELDVFASLEGIKVVIDVGARTDADMTGMKPDYEYHLFEPHTPFFEQLPKNVHTYNVALSDKEEELVYDITTQSFVNRLDNPANTVKYKTKRLDDFGIKADFIKIDAEGMDYRILLGAPETIKHAKYIQFEYWDGVRKFTELLQGFDFYLMIEPELRKHTGIVESLVPLDIEYVDKVLIPKGLGGNILAIRR